MEFDPVHDLQQAFRKTVQAFSFPGRLVDLTSHAQKLQFELTWPPAMLVVGWMLLDTETSYACANAAAAKILALLTFARPKPTPEAGYIFCDGRAGAFLQVLAEAPLADLVDPHASATIVALADFGPESPAYSLTGPGIESATTCHIGLAEGWLAQRAERNQEFPMGLDLILIDQHNQLMALPRTTRIASVESRQPGIAQQNDFQKSPAIGRQEISKRMPPASMRGI